MQPLAFVDLETTGATATHDRITEIGIIEVDADGVVREWQQLVNPGMSISPFIEQLTGISDAMVAEAPAFADVANEVLRRLEGRLFIAHNARFDYGFLKAEFGRLGITFRAPVLCTVKLSRALFPEHHRHNLDSLIERHGLQAAARHRALADAQLIHQFWQKIHVDRSPEAIETAIQAQNGKLSLPPQLDARLIDELPETAGVYLFYDADGLPLHIGPATDLRKGVLAHFKHKRPSAKEARLAQQVSRIDWVETSGEIGALLTEARLVRQLRPGHQQRPEQPDETCTWMLIDEGEGWLRPQLLPAHDLDFSLRTACYGLFRNAKEAHSRLRALADSEKLCRSLLGLEKHAPGQPCAGYASKSCKGACCGKENLARHTVRLLAALTQQKLVSWPFPGPALIREGDAAHLLDSWRYLGTVRRDEEIDALLAAGRPPFDRDTYKILAKYVGKMTPLAVQRTASPE